MMHLLFVLLSVCTMEGKKARKKRAKGEKNPQ
jgi:hypothetical protein